MYLLSHATCLLLYSVDVSYHGERHAVDFVFVFGLVLSEGTMPKAGERVRDNVDTGDDWEQDI